MRRRPTVRAAVAAAVLLALAGRAHAAVGLRPRAGLPPRMATLEPAARLSSSAALPDTPPLEPSRIVTGPLPRSTDALHHGSLLPRSITSALISQREKLVLGFLLEFLHEEGLNAPLFLSGGYVRDLLLGQAPDDLDVSIDLRACPPGVSIGSLTAALPRYAESRPALGVCDVELKTALSDASRAKSVDTAKIRMSVGGQRLTVDVLPTIGLEVYDEGDRVPRRDVRGSPQQDALRRDLTVGSLLLHVTRGQAWTQSPAQSPTGERPAADEAELFPSANLFEWLPVDWAWNAWAARRGMGKSDSKSDPNTGTWRRAMTPAFTRSYLAATAASSLQYRLLDWYGGLADLRLGLLRSPYPRDVPLAEVWQEALPSEAERRLAARVGIGTRLSAHPPVWACGSRLGVSCRTHAGWAFGGSGAARLALAVPEASRERQAMLQTVWWVKVLRDDPVRLVRALRFRATLRFELHEAFWLAAPLAVAALRSKVAGSRKAGELRKVARAGGIDAILAFYELACGQPICPGGIDTERSGMRCLCLAPALFGHVATGPTHLYDPACFSASAMRRAAAAIPATPDAEERLGLCLAAALGAYAPLPHQAGHARNSQPAGVLGGALWPSPSDQGSRSSGNDGACSKDSQDSISASNDGACSKDSDAIVDAAAAAALRAAEEAALVASDSLQASATMRDCAVKPLNRAAALLAPSAVLPHHTALAAACPSTSAAEFAALCRMWDLLGLEKHAPHPNEALPAQGGGAQGGGARAEGTQGGGVRGEWARGGKAQGGGAQAAAAEARARAAAAKAPPAAICPPLALALATTHCSASTARRLQRRMAQLTGVKRTGYAPVINGRAVAGVAGIPPRLRGSAISALHVALRLRGEAPLLLEPSDVDEALQRLGAVGCFGEEGVR